MNPQIQDIVNNLPTRWDQPQQLTEDLIKLASTNLNLGVEMAEAHLAEVNVASNYMSQVPATGEKKMTNAEAEKHAITETFNEYEKLSNQHEDVVELMNVIKKRIEILSWEFRNG